MRIALCFVSLVICASLLNAQSNTTSKDCPIQRSATDVKSLEFVKSAFEFFREAETKGIFSSQMKPFLFYSPSLPEYGDSVSVAVLKIYKLEELRRPENTRAYLSILQLAFSDRRKVLDKSDEEPRISTLLLDYVEKTEGLDANSTKALANARECVPTFSCAPAWQQNGQFRVVPCSQTSNDPYTLFFVRSARGQGVWGAQIHHFNNNSPGLPQLGDAVSIAVLKLYGLDELVTPENTRSYLTLVIYGFSDRNRILEKSDQDARITSLVLDYLEQKKMSDSAFKNQISYIRVCVKDFTCSFKNEAEFIDSR